MQVTFLDVLLSGEKPTKAAKFLQEIDQSVPWYRINKLLKSWKEADTGRKGFSPETMFRMSLLKDFYGLSDAETEEQIHDRLSFRKFMKIGLDEPIPDETTLCKFRSWLTEHNKQEELFRIVNRYLDEKGHFIKKGVLVDATIIDAPMNKSNDKKEWIDKDATSTKKGSKWFRGYKAHIGTDQGSNLIVEVITTTAKVSDTVCFDALVPEYATAVLGDKGYFSKERKKALRERGVFCGILDKPGPGKKLSNKQIKRNKKLSAARAFVEHPFNIIKNRFKFKKTRYVGIIKNTAQIYILAALHNLYKVRKMLEPKLLLAH
jgi:IS5 family transposase